MTWACYVCNAPIPGVPVVIEVGSFHAEERVHRACALARLTNDREAILAARKAACAAGHHKHTGAWTKDPADPYGDASYWDCAYGCGYRRTHPGYGIGRQIHDLGLTDLEPGEGEGPDVATSSTAQPEQSDTDPLGPPPFVPEQRQGGEV